MSYKNLSWQEKLLALEILMTDMKGYWGGTFYRSYPLLGRGWDITRRRRKWALQLAQDLYWIDNSHSAAKAQGLREYILRIVGRLYVFEKNVDGRFLRQDISQGGYERMNEFHGIPQWPDSRKYEWGYCSLNFQRYIKGKTKAPLDHYFEGYKKQTV